MKRLFTAIAKRYDRMNRIMSLSLDRRWRRAALLAADGFHGQALDLACGTGDFAAELLHRFPDADVTGVDITPAMLEIARARLDTKGVKFIEGDAHDLSALPSGTFGIAVCAFGFRNFQDKAKVLSECHRVLALDGKLVVLELFRPESRILGALVNAWLAAVSAVFAAGSRAEYAYLRRSVARTVSADEFAAMADTAGFSVACRRFFLPAATCMVLRRT